MPKENENPACSVPGCPEPMYTVRAGDAVCRKHDLLAIERQAEIQRRIAAVQTEVEELAKLGVRLKVSME